MENCIHWSVFTDYSSTTGIESNYIPPYMTPWPPILLNTTGVFKLNKIMQPSKWQKHSIPVLQNWAFLETARLLGSLPLKVRSFTRKKLPSCLNSNLAEASEKLPRRKDWWDTKKVWAWEIEITFRNKPGEKCDGFLKSRRMSWRRTAKSQYITFQIQNLLQGNF